MISPANEILVDSCIAGIDCHYPRHPKEIGMYLSTGNQQVSSAGQDEIIHSGSMTEADRLERVRKAFDLFI